VAWSAPMTAVSGSVFTAAQFNTYVRDNLNECPTAKATSAGQIFVSSAANTIAARKVAADFISTSETSSSTSYTDLATTGPTVTATTSLSAIVSTYCNMTNATNPIWMSYALSGATTDAANDNRGIQVQAAGGQRIGGTFFHSAILTAGTNTFTAKYRVSTSGTGTWSDRRLMVIPM
jgi:hypothetical protein